MALFHGHAFLSGGQIPAGSGFVPIVVESDTQWHAIQKAERYFAQDSFYKDSEIKTLICEQAASAKSIDAASCMVLIP